MEPESYPYVECRLKVFLLGEAAVPTLKDLHYTVDEKNMNVVMTDLGEKVAQDRAFFFSKRFWCRVTVSSFWDVHPRYSQPFGVVDFMC